MKNYFPTKKHTRNKSTSQVGKSEVQEENTTQPSDPEIEDSKLDNASDDMTISTIQNTNNTQLQNNIESSQYNISSGKDNELGKGILT